MHRLSNRAFAGDDMGDYDLHKMRRPALRVRTWERKQTTLTQASKRGTPHLQARREEEAHRDEAQDGAPGGNASGLTSTVSDEDKKARRQRAKLPPPSRIEMVAQKWASGTTKVPRSRLKQLRLTAEIKPKEKKWWNIRNRHLPGETQDEVAARIALSPELHAEFMHHTNREAQKSGDGWYLRVDSRVRTCIDVISLVAVIYCTFVVPFDLLFSPDKTTWSVVMDIVVEVFFIAEIVVNFFTSYYDEESVHVTRRSMIAKHYLKGWFIVDLAGSIPGECLTQIVQAASGLETPQDSSLDTLYSLKAVRIIRLFKLVRLLRIDALLENIEFSITALTAILGLVRLLLMISILSHLTACLFYYMGTRNIYNSWISKYHLGCCDPTTIEAPLDDPNHVCLSVDELPTIEKLYTDCIYWSITTIAAVGYGDITPCNSEEQVFAVVAMVLGSALFAYVVGAISSVFATGTAHDKRLQNRMAQLHDYLQIRHIPADMARLIRLQCAHKWKRTVFNEESLLNDFMPQTRRDVVEHILGNYIRSIPMFRYIKNPDYLTDATLMFKPVVANEESAINKIGDVAPDLYVLVEGTVQLLDEDGNVVATVKRGMSINEDELVGSIRETEAQDKFLSATYTSRPVGSAELFLLSRADFIVLLRRYPAIRKLYSDFAQDSTWQSCVNSSLSGAGPSTSTAKASEGNGAHAGTDEKPKDLSVMRDPLGVRPNSKGSDSSVGANGHANIRMWVPSSPSGVQISPAGQGRLVSPSSGHFKVYHGMQDHASDKSPAERLMLAIQAMQAQIDRRNQLLEASGLNIPYTPTFRLGAHIHSPIDIDEDTAATHGHSRQSPAGRSAAKHIMASRTRSAPNTPFGIGPSETHVLEPPPEISLIQRSESLKEMSWRQLGSQGEAHTMYGASKPSGIALVPTSGSVKGNTKGLGDWATASFESNGNASNGVSPAGKSGVPFKSAISGSPFKSAMKFFQHNGNGNGRDERCGYAGGNVATLLPTSDAETSQMLLQRDGSKPAPPSPSPSPESKVALLLPNDML